MGFPMTYVEKCFFFSTIPRHVTPQIDCLTKMIPVLRFSTTLMGFFDEIDEKMCILRVNLGM